VVRIGREPVESLPLNAAAATTVDTPHRHLEMDPQVAAREIAEPPHVRCASPQVPQRVFVRAG